MAMISLIKIPAQTAKAACRYCSYLNRPGFCRALSAEARFSFDVDRKVMGPRTPYYGELCAANDSIGIKIRHISLLYR